MITDKKPRCARLGHTSAPCAGEVTHCKGCGRPECEINRTSMHPDLCGECYVEKDHRECGSKGCELVFANNKVVCWHCTTPLDYVLAKNIVYDKVTVTVSEKGEYEHKEYVEQGECDPFPCMVCPHCLLPLNSSDPG